MKTESIKDIGRIKLGGLAPVAKTAIATAALTVAGTTAALAETVEIGNVVGLGVETLSMLVATVVGGAVTWLVGRFLGDKAALEAKAIVQDALDKATDYALAKVGIEDPEATTADINNKVIAMGVEYMNKMFDADSEVLKRAKVNRDVFFDQITARLGARFS